MKVKIIECPRDAMQGIHDFIPTELKIEYINQLLKTGFNSLDCGSFVSPKQVPQMYDTIHVLNAIKIDKQSPGLLTIVANERGVLEAVKNVKVSYIGFPFSVSEVFQQRNTNLSRESGFELLLKLKSHCEDNGKIPVAYMSMCFGNPYEEEWNTDLSIAWAHKIAKAGFPIISLSDTDGSAIPEDISTVFNALANSYPKIEFGAHFHAKPGEWLPNIEAAFNAGCRRFDGALKGFGGCPFAKDELTGNIPTEELIVWLESKGCETGIDKAELANSLILANKVFG